MKFHIYKDSAGEWRWRLKAANGRTIADSGEGYSTKSNCRRAVNELSGATNIPVDEDDE
jgi:uncharacterized protein